MIKQFTTEKAAEAHAAAICGEPPMMTMYKHGVIDVPGFFRGHVQCVAPCESVVDMHGATHLVAGSDVACYIVRTARQLPADRGYRSADLWIVYEDGDDVAAWLKE